MFYCIHYTYTVLCHNGRFSHVFPSQCILQMTCHNSLDFFLQYMIFQINFAFKVFITNLTLNILNFSCFFQRRFVNFSVCFLKQLVQMLYFLIVGLQDIFYLIHFTIFFTDLVVIVTFVFQIFLLLQIKPQTQNKDPSQFYFSWAFFSESCDFLEPIFFRPHSVELKILINW